jgi:hypothetical protein
MKNVYEILDEFELATNKQERMKVIEKNLSQTLVDVLRLTFHPDFRWKVKEFPENYKPAMDTLPGNSPVQLSTEIRKMYLWQEGNPTAEKLTPRKQQELLIQLLESLEPREAEVIAGIFRKDLGVKGLDYKFVKEAFPQLLP